MRILTVMVFQVTRNCLRTAVWLTSAFALALSGGHDDGRINDAPAGAQIPQTAECYWGAARDAATQPWFFCVDRRSKGGVLYQPPGLLRLRDLEFKLDDHVSFRSEVFWGKRYYVFEGSTSGEILEGRIEEFEIDPRLEAGSKSAERIRGFDIKAEKLGPIRGSKLGIWAAHRFSNVHYVEDSGDLVGAELILVRRPNRCIGLVTFYESYWGEPTLVPLSLGDLRCSATRLRFKLKVGERTGVYVVRINGERAILNRKDVETTGKVALKRSTSFLPKILD